MKRTIGGILLFVILLAVSVRADETRTVRIDALDLRIEVPAFYQVITRDTDTSDPDLGAYIADVQQWMEENNPHAMMEMINRLMEAYDRGMWNAKPETLQKLKDLYLDLDERIEELQDR